MGDRSFSTIDLNHFRRGIWTRTRDRRSWRLETVWKSLKYRILSDLYRRQSHLLRWRGWPLVVSRSYCDTRLDLALSSDDNNIPHFIWTTTKCQNQWFCKYHSQLLYCSEIVLRKNGKWNSPQSGLYTLFVFCFLINEATLNIAWFVSSRTTWTNL